MITFTQGNLLNAKVEALVNTVNAVGVMGKGIALMFKEAFPQNFAQYSEACKREGVQVGRMFVTETGSMLGPRWIINFPTKKHWRGKTRPEWIEEGLVDLRRVVEELSIRSLAVPPLGCGHGGLSWHAVKPMIEQSLGSLPGIEVLVYEPTAQYQNVAKRRGVERLTPARALIAELVRRYWVLGIECTILEIQKLAWLLERQIDKQGLDNPLDLQFEANRFGPYADRLRHLLDGLDGSYLHCSKRVADASPTDTIWFEDSRKDRVRAYLHSEGKTFLPALEATVNIIDGFESPLGLEALATVDWLIDREGCSLDVDSLREGLANWPAGKASASRKMRIIDDRLLGLASDRLAAH